MIYSVLTICHLNNTWYNEFLFLVPVTRTESGRLSFGPVSLATAPSTATSQHGTTNSGKNIAIIKYVNLQYIVWAAPSVYIKCVKTVSLTLLED